jgi:hypothetical protein
VVLLLVTAGPELHHPELLLFVALASDGVGL